MAFHIEIQKNRDIHILFVEKRGPIIYLAVLKKGAIRHAHPYYAIYRKLLPSPPPPPPPPSETGFYIIRNVTDRLIIVVCCDLQKILTPLHVLFLICHYISSRALSKVFEHRNFVARYRRETNHICESFAPPGKYGR